MGAPPLPARTPLAQVLLGVGAVLVVSGGAAALAATGDPVTRALLLVLAAVLAGCSVWAAAGGLRATRETLAACAVGLGLAGSGALTAHGPSGALPAGALAAGCLLVHLLERSAATWLLGAWGAGQLAVLHLLPLVPERDRTAVELGVALLGLALAAGPGRLVPRVALLTTAPWLLAGSAGALAAAWTAGTGRRWLAVLLLAAPMAGLLVARLRPALTPLLGPPRAVPLVAGAVTGGGLAGALAGWGTPGVVLAGYAGVLAATTVRELLTGWPRGLLGPVAVAGGGVMALVALADLGGSGRWSALALLFLLTALPAALVALLRPAERPAAVPTAAGCLAIAAALAVPAGVLAAGTAAWLLTGLVAATLAVVALLPRRSAGEAVAAGCAALGVVLAVGAGSGTAALVALLLVQGGLSLGWAARPGAGAARASWRAGAAELVAAAWVAAGSAHAHLVEAWTLPLAAGLLLAAGRRLASGPSWPAWAPGLLVAAAPSTVLAVVEPGVLRPVAVLVVAALAMVGGVWRTVRAPLLVGGWTEVALALGLAAVTLPWPLVAALATGAALLALGARNEWTGSLSLGNLR